MKSGCLIFLMLPFLAATHAQSPSAAKKSAEVVKKTTTVSGFVIAGSVTGFENGTPVAFLNEQTGEPEQQATIQNGQFLIKGKMDQPGFKGMLFANAQPVIPLFLDNSSVKITGDKNALNELKVTGSPSHAEFIEYSKAMEPYAKIFTAEAERDASSIAAIKKVCEDFVKNHPASYVSPLAVIRLYQVTEDGVKAEELFKLLPQQIQLSYLGTYANQQIQESKINPLGAVISDFSQKDTAGNPVSISSFRGKYVLIDFWASWCRPCRMENPNVVAAYNKFKDKNFTVLGVSLDQAKQAWMNAIEMDNLAWSHVSDLKGWGNAVAAQFQVKGIPQNLLIDPQGRIVGKNLRGEVLGKKLEELLK